MHIYPALMFHSFNKNKYADEFYDVSFENYLSLIDYLAKKINPNKITITFDDGFKSIIPAVELAIKNGYQTIAYIITDYVDKEGFLSKKDINYLDSIGCIIGSHSKSHKDLSKVSSKILKMELQKSKIFLEKIIGKEVLYFSFPYGSYNQYVKRKVKSIYKFNAISRPNFLREKNIIGRISINSFNCKRHEDIKNLLIKRFSYKYIIRLFFSFFLKKTLHNNIYIFLKNLISKDKSEDVFKIE